MVYVVLVEFEDGREVCSAFEDLGNANSFIDRVSSDEDIEDVRGPFAVCVMKKV